MGIALQARHPNENLQKNLKQTSVSSVWSVDVFGVASQEIFEGNLFKEWPWARNYYGSTEDTEGTDG